MKGLQLGDIFHTETDEVVLIMEGQIVTGSSFDFRHDRRWQKEISGRQFFPETPLQHPGY